MWNVVVVTKIVCDSLDRHQSLILLTAVDYLNLRAQMGLSRGFNEHIFITISAQNWVIWLNVYVVSLIKLYIWVHHAFWIVIVLICCFNGALDRFISCYPILAWKCILLPASVSLCPILNIALVYRAIVISQSVRCVCQWRFLGTIFEPSAPVRWDKTNFFLDLAQRLLHHKSVRSLHGALLFQNWVLPFLKWSAGLFRVSVLTDQRLAVLEC